MIFAIRSTSRPCTSTLQHLFFTLPRVITLLGALVILDVSLLGYLVHHVHLLCRNRTSFEHGRLRRWTKLQTARYGGADRSECPSLLPHRRRTTSGVGGAGFYDLGLWCNLCEVFGPQTVNSLRELKRRLPAQMDFKCR